MKNLTIIDLDSIMFYVAGGTVYKDVKCDEFTQPKLEADVRKYIDDILKQTEADLYAGFYQKAGHKNFRKILYPEYKANRPPTPEFIIEWRDTVHKVFNEYKGITGLQVIESDDALSILYYKYHKDYEITLSHVDKDLNCIPGRHHKYSKNELYHMSWEDAIINGKAQVISGDSDDNVPGIFGIGQAKAIKYLAMNEMKLVKAFKHAFEDQKAKGKMPDISWRKLFYTTYHSIRLLQDISELKRYTSDNEVDIFYFESLEIAKVNVAGLGDW